MDQQAVSVEGHCPYRCQYTSHLLLLEASLQLTGGLVCLTTPPFSPEVPPTHPLGHVLT